MTFLKLGSSKLEHLGLNLGVNAVYRLKHVESTVLREIACGKRSIQLDATVTVLNEDILHISVFSRCYGCTTAIDFLNNVSIYICILNLMESSLAVINQFEYHILHTP